MFHRLKHLLQPVVIFACVQVEKLSCKGSVLDYYVMRMEEGGEGSGQEALGTFGIGKVWLK